MLNYLSLLYITIKKKNKMVNYLSPIIIIIIYIYNNRWNWEKLKLEFQIRFSILRDVS